MQVEYTGKKSFKIKIGSHEVITDLPEEKISPRLDDDKRKIVLGSRAEKGAAPKN